LLKEQFEKVGAETDELKFTFQRDMDVFAIRAPFHLRLRVRLRAHTMNCATESRLECIYYQLAQPEDFARERREPHQLYERTFRPYFGHDGEPVWTNPNSTETFMTSEQVVVILSERLIDYIEKESRKH
jgi:hypothetical protein